MSNYNRAHDWNAYGNDQILKSRIYRLGDEIASWLLTSVNRAKGVHNITFNFGDISYLKTEQDWDWFAEEKGWSPSEVLEAAMFQLTQKLGCFWIPNRGFKYTRSGINYVVTFEL